MAEADAEPPVDWLVFRVVGRRVLTLVSAPPGGGKGYWTWGYLRAMQDGLDFFGLAVRRPWSSPGWLARRFGAKPRPLKVLWMTEEGPSFKTTADAFGIRPGLVARIRRDQVPTSDWPAIVRLARREARKKGCGLVIFDTIRAWCPQAERSPEEANAVMLVARQELARDGLAVQFVHHDSKAGGDFGAGVSGTYGLVGAVDVLVELRRVSDDPKDARRRMLVSRRYGDQDVVAALRDHRYVTDGRPSSPGTPGGESAPPGVPSHLQRTRTTLTSGPPRTVGELLAVEGGGESALIARLKALEQLGQAERRGRGVKGDPVRWTAPAVHPEAPGAPVAVRDDPAYVAYLKSPAWAARRREALTRAGGECQRCGPGGAPGEEVHHLTYERLYDELPGDLIALCAPCHRRAHPPA